MKNEIVALAYPVLFDMESSGTYTITFSDLPGCISCAVNREQGFFMVRHALCAWLEVHHDLGNSIPEPSSLSDHPSETGQFLCLIKVERA